MIIAPNKRAKRARKATSWGSAGVGIDGPCVVEIDEALTGATRWRINVEFSTFDLSFEMANLAGLEPIRRFFADPKITSNSLTLGSSGIELLRDDETAGRFFVLLRAPGKSLVRLALLPRDVEHLSRALDAAVSSSLS